MRVVGVHRVPAEEPLHLIEVVCGAGGSTYDWGSVTQSLIGREPSDWQVAYDEQPVPGRPGHWCFYFHYLDPARSLQCPTGELVLPSETPVPDHLAFMNYEAP